MIVRLKIVTGTGRPGVELHSDDLLADLAVYGRLRIELALEPAIPALVATCPDRREALARLEPLPQGPMETLLEGVRRSEGRIDLAMIDPGEGTRVPLARPGDLPHALDPTGGLVAWRDALVTGRLDEAVAALDRLAKRDERFPLLPLFRGETHEAAGDPRAAEDAFRLELGFRPGNFLARAALGRLLRATGRPAESFAEHVEALRVHPCHVESLLALAALVDGIENLLPILARLVRIDPARADLDRIFVEREREFGGLTREQTLDRARRLALATDPGSPLLLPRLARPGLPPADPVAGALTVSEILRYLLEEIMADGSLEARERELAAAVRDAFGIDAESYRAIVREAEVALKAKPAPRQGPLDEARLYRRVIDRALADGRISPAERSLLRRLGDALLVTPDEHARLLRAALADRGYIV